MANHWGERMTYQVVVPLVIAKDQSGAPHHVYEGGIIQWLNTEQAAHFVSTGLVVDLDGKSSVEVEPEVGPEDDDGEAPAKAASKAEWVDYAVASGYDRAEVEEMTKAEIQALDFA